MIQDSCQEGRQAECPWALTATFPHHHHPHNAVRTTLKSKPTPSAWPLWGLPASHLQRARVTPTLRWNAGGSLPPHPSLAPRGILPTPAAPQQATMLHTSTPLPTPCPCLGGTPNLGWLHFYSASGSSFQEPHPPTQVLLRCSHTARDSAVTSPRRDVVSSVTRRGPAFSYHLFRVFVPSCRGLRPSHGRGATGVRTVA